MYLRTFLAAFALVAASLLTPAVATAKPPVGKHYANCDALHRDFKHGVAKSPKAAAKQVRDGYGRPSTTKKAKAVYKRNNGPLDRDNDGTACEA